MLTPQTTRTWAKPPWYAFSPGALETACFLREKAREGSGLLVAAGGLP